MGFWLEHIIPGITIYHSMQNSMQMSNFYSKFWFRPRILRYRRFSNFAWADSKKFCLMKSQILFWVKIYAYSACFILVRIDFEIRFGILNADLATLNSRIDQFGSHIRIQETKLHQNPTLDEKIFFWSKMAFTLHPAVNHQCVIPVNGNIPVNVVSSDILLLENKKYHKS